MSHLCDPIFHHVDIYKYWGTFFPERLRLLEAVNVLGKEIKFLSEEEINLYDAPSGSQANRFGLTGVAEPSALALSKKKELILRKKVYGRITIAIAE